MSQNVTRNETAATADPAVEDEQRKQTPVRMPNKKKRKSELEKLLEDNVAHPSTTTTDTEDNPWTPRENLEVLRIQEDFHGSKAERKVALLNDMMSRVRYSASQPQKPGRTSKEFVSQVRQLQKDGVTLDDLEAEVFPPEPPRKRAKRKATS